MLFFARPEQALRRVTLFSKASLYLWQKCILNIEEPVSFALQKAVSVAKASTQAGPQSSIHELEGLLSDLQGTVKLLHRKFEESEQKQTVMAQEYGMLVRRPYMGYR